MHKLLKNVKSEKILDYLLLFLLFILIFCSFAYAIPFTPQGNIDLKNYYNMTNLSYFTSFIMLGNLDLNNYNITNITAIDFSSLLQNLNVNNYDIYNVQNLNGSRLYVTLLNASNLTVERISTFRMLGNINMNLYDLFNATNLNSTILNSENITVSDTITDGTFSVTGGAFTGVSSITDGTFSVTGGAFTGVSSITDGTASWSSNALSGFTSLSGTTLTDSILSISSGSIISASDVNSTRFFSDELISIFNSGNLFLYDTDESNYYSLYHNNSEQSLIISKDGTPVLNITDNFYIVNNITIGDDFSCNSCINTEDVGDIDLADIEGDQNTFVDIPGDTMTGTLNITISNAVRGLYIDHNGNYEALSIENTGNTKTGLIVYSNMDSGSSDSLVDIVATNPLFDQPVVEIWNDGTNHALYLKHDGTGNTIYEDQGNNGSIGLSIDKDITNRGDTVGNILIDYKAIVTDGNTYSVSGNALSILLSEQETSGTITGTRKGIYIDTIDAGEAIYIDHNGNYDAFNMENTGNAKSAIRVYSNNDSSQDDPLVELIANNETFDQPILKTQNEGTQDSVFIDQNGNGNSLYVDSESTTNAGINVSMADTGYKAFFTNAIINTTSKIEAEGAEINYMNLFQIDNTFGLRLTSTKGTTGRPLLYINVTNSSYINTPVQIYNNGSTSSIYIEQNGNTGFTGSLEIDNTDNTGYAFVASSNMDSSADYPLAYLYAQNESFDHELLRLRNDGAEDGLFIDQNKGRYSLYIDTEVTAWPAMFIAVPNTKVEAILANGNITTTSSVKAGDYYGGNGNQGITDSSSYWLCTAADCSTKCQVSIEDGLIVGCT